MSALCARGLPLAAASGFLFVLVDSRVGHRESKRGFRPLRRATQGSALRTRKPLKRFDRNFNYGCGALFSDAEIREDMIYDIILDTLTGQFSKALNRALDIIYHGIRRKTGF